MTPASRPLLLALTVGAAASAFAADPAALKELDDLYLHRHQAASLDASLQKTQEALKGAPKDGALLWRLGRDMVAAADKKPGKDAKVAALKEAGAVLRRAVDAAPEDSMAHYWLARQMGSLNDLLRTLSLARSMKKELEAAVKSDPANEPAHETLGELLRQLPGLFGGDKKKTVREEEEALRLDPNDTGAYPAAAEAYLAVGDKQKAIDVLKKLSEVKAPSDPASSDDDVKNAAAMLKKLAGG